MSKTPKDAKARETFRDLAKRTMTPEAVAKADERTAEMLAHLPPVSPDPDLSDSKGSSF